MPGPVGRVPLAGHDPLLGPFATTGRHHVHAQIRARLDEREEPLIRRRHLRDGVRRDLDHLAFPRDPPVDVEGYVVAGT